MSLHAVMLNGERVNAGAPLLQATERGFHYGDGLFETMLLQAGRVRLLEDHWQRLSSGCQRLNLPLPSRTQWQTELQQLMHGHADAVIKFVLTRGVSERGYRPVAAPATRLWQLSSAPPAGTDAGIAVRWCATRVSRNALLAGLKHCNRLEQVMAQSEWQDAAIAEGLMLDTEGELVCATMSNVFLWIDGAWVTPDLRYSGVAGVMRAALLRLVHELAVPVQLRAVHADEVTQAEEMFVCNAVRGIRPVIALDNHQWPVGMQTMRLLDAWSCGS